MVRRCLLRYGVWLRRNYAFPIQVSVYLLPGASFTTSDGEQAEASFFAPDSPREEPFIRLATGDYAELQKKLGRDNALACYIGALSRQLIHYQVWLQTGNFATAAELRKGNLMLRRYNKDVAHP